MARLLEHRREPLVSNRVFVLRLTAFAAAALGVIVIALGIGMLGYRQFEGMSWLDAFLNAAMILGGMGPVETLHTTGGKLFAGFYALLCGLVFIGVTGIVLAPVFHRLLHRFHVADED